LLVISPTTVIGAGAVIRSHSVIYTHVEIGDSLATGQGIMIREHTRIGDNCVFGTHASTDGYCLIGPKAHIGQYAQLSQAARLGKCVFIGGHTVFSDNVQAIRDVSEDLFGAIVEDYVRIGLSCVILPSVRIGAYALVGAGAVVTRDVPQRMVAYGNPAKVARELTEEEILRYLASVDAKD
jgi:acetyltransferase-like isoleucine patch superfamily enzyme